ncbi:unnamed protein product [Lasius platythorax]|uniref:Uncharacterized protein n=1 Tax=Lasius platythorax TaxID=488582 RepID=A0AAV2P5Z7_9HYME
MHDRRHVSRNKFSGYRVYFRFAGRRPVPRTLNGGIVANDQRMQLQVRDLARSHTGVPTTRVVFGFGVPGREEDSVPVVTWSASDVSDIRCDRL